MEIKLLSAPMVHTPSIIKLVMQLAGENKMQVADKILESYGLEKSVRNGVLFALIPWRIEGETVVIMMDKQIDPLNEKQIFGNVRGM
jgi:hypothetical protein